MKTRRGMTSASFGLRAWTGVMALAIILAPVVLLVPGVWAQTEGNTLTGSEENPLTPVEDSFSFASEDGDFRVIWPSGCANLRTRSPIQDDYSDSDGEKEYPVIVTCDRYGEKGEGCSVTAIFNVKSISGGPVGPAEVIPRLKKMLKSLGAQIQKQKPIRKDFGDGAVAEGIDIQAAQPQGVGQVWLRGLVVHGDVYIMAAWDLGGQVWDNPEYITFFNSFQPGYD